VSYNNKYKTKRKKVRLTDILYIFELIKRQRTGMNRLKIVYVYLFKLCLIPPFNLLERGEKELNAS
jgi:hypothetical protein